MSTRVQICEVGPRDGLQIASQRMPTDVKLRWIRQLAAAGLKHIEVGSFVSRGWCRKWPIPRRW